MGSVTSRIHPEPLQVTPVTSLHTGVTDPVGKELGQVAIFYSSLFLRKNEQGTVTSMLLLT